MKEIDDEDAVIIRRNVRFFARGDSLEFSDSSLPDKSEMKKTQKNASLPIRFQKMLENNQGNNEINNCTVQQRQQDISDALKWLRQEILELKEQDKILTSLFLGLRSTVRNIIGRHVDGAGLTSHHASISTFEDLLESPTDDFRSRTMSFTPRMFFNH